MKKRVCRQTQIQDLLTKWNNWTLLDPDLNNPTLYDIFWDKWKKTNMNWTWDKNREITVSFDRYDNGMLLHKQMFLFSLLLCMFDIIYIIK